MLDSLFNKVTGLIIAILVIVEFFFWRKHKTPFLANLQNQFRAVYIFTVFKILLILLRDLQNF